MNLTLRAATEADAKLLFDWRNDPDTRRNSFNTEPVRWDDHMRWFSASLHRPDRRLLVAEAADGPVGTVRLDFVSGECKLSWTVAPAYRGLGYGKAMVAAAMAVADARTLAASIKSGNAASRRIAEMCGFRCVSEKEGTAYYRMEKAEPPRPS